MFVKTLPVYCQADGKLSVDEYVRAVGEQLIGCMENDIYSFSEISSEYDIPADISIAYQDELTEGVLIGGELCELKTLSLDTAKFPLSIDVFISGGKLRLLAEYRADMFSETLVSGFVDALEKAADEFIRKDRLGSVSLMTAEQEKATAQFNQTDYPVEMLSIDKLFERQVEKAPGHKAVIADGVELTYSELNERANRIAHTLLGKGLKLGETVGMLLPRTVDAIAAEYGIVKAGGAFLPMLPGYPDDRIDYCLTDSGSRFVITTDEILNERSGLLSGKAYQALTVSELYKTEKTDNPNKPVEKTAIFGDIDGDGKITSADSLFILRCSVNLENFTDEQEMLADVDGDGKITSADALFVLRCSVGLKDNTKAGETIILKVS